MRIIIIIASFLIACTAKSQSKAGEYFTHFNLERAKANLYYSFGKNDSAVFYLQKLVNSAAYSKEEKAIAVYDIAAYSLLRKDTVTAEKLVTQNASSGIIGKQYNYLFNQPLCEMLADFYYAKKNYKKSLAYLDSFKIEAKKARKWCNHGINSWGNELRFAGRQARCYYALGEKDSVIAKLAPVIFQDIALTPSYGATIDSANYIFYSELFVKTVWELFGSQKTKLEMQKALDNLQYNLTDKEYTSIGGSQILMTSATCYLYFLNVKINLDEGSSAQVNKEYPLPNFLSKEGLLKIFTASYAYKSIMQHADELVLKN